jgi:RimJ/RimL family protein N-acetyltransferase
MFASGAPTDGVVVLTPFAAADAPVLRDADRDPEIRLRFGFPDDFVPSIEHSLAVVSRWKRERETSARLTLAVRDSVAGTLLGGCELLPLGSGVANLSYWTYPTHRNRGIASRAVAIAVKLAFTELKMARLEVVVDPDNHYSRKVALNNGFEESGTRGKRILYVLDNTASHEHA